MSYTVYTPAKEFSTGIQKVYLQTKTIEKTLSSKTDSALTSFNDAYQELTRMFGIEVAQDTIKKEILTPKNTSEKSVIDSIFTHDIALWISVGTGLMVFSIYMNIIMLIGFFLKPITFFMK